jgi:DNA-binding NtrC family response regulator
MKNEPKAVLIVDDERDMCWALGYIFRNAGYLAKTVCTGHEALELVAERNFPLIILDAKLPDIEGLELASEIRILLPSSKILVVSGYFYQDDPDIRQAMKNGLISGFIAKPFVHEAVLKKAERAMSKTAAGTSTPASPLTGNTATTLCNKFPGSKSTI